MSVFPSLGVKGSWFRIPPLRPFSLILPRWILSRKTLLLNCIHAGAPDGLRAWWRMCYSQIAVLASFVPVLPVMDVTFFQQLIDSEITELRALSSNSRESRAPVQLDQQSVGRLSRMDAMQQQSMDVAREERRQARLAALASARRRIDSDDYGYCLGCGEDIAEARLKIDPAVTLCVDCQALRHP